jgi:hypothetical protein
VKANCPAPICRPETQYMWPWMPEPGILVSLATGSLEQAPRWETARRSRKKRFPFRLYDALMSSMDADEAWRALMAQLDETTKQSYHRLTVHFKGQPPSLDSVSSIDQMVKLVKEQGTRNKVQRVLSELLVCSLFFEVRSFPRWDGRRYHCVGSIRCRLAGSVFVSILARLHHCKMTYFCGSSNLNLSPSEEVICEECSRYCVAVRFIVNSLDQPISLSLRLGDNERPRLGGFPHPLQWFLDQQGLGNVGENGWQGIPPRVPCKACDRRIDRKWDLIPRNQDLIPQKRDLIPIWRYRKRVRFI